MKIKTKTKTSENCLETVSRQDTSTSWRLLCHHLPFPISLVMSLRNKRREKEEERNGVKSVVKSQDDC